MIDFVRSEIAADISLATLRIELISGVHFVVRQTVPCVTPVRMSVVQLQGCHVTVYSLQCQLWNDGADAFAGVIKV